VQAGQFSLELLVIRRVAGDVARAAGSDTVLVRRVAIVASATRTHGRWRHQLTDTGTRRVPSIYNNVFFIHRRSVDR